MFREGQACVAWCLCEQPYTKPTRFQPVRTAFSTLLPWRFGCGGASRVVTENQSALDSCKARPRACRDRPRLRRLRLARRVKKLERC